MLASPAHPAVLTLDTDTQIARWRPLVQWILVIPHLIVVNALSTLRGTLTLIGAAAVVITGRVPRPLFDAITMTHRYEWRALSYAAFLTDDYPPFEFMPAAEDDGHQPHTVLAITYPDRLDRWKPLYKWLLAIPQYLVCIGLAIASIVTIVWTGVVVIVTGSYPARSKQFLTDAYRYGLRVQAYVAPLTDEYPPFRLAG